MNQRQTKLWKQFISIMLAVVLLVTSVDLPVLASAVEATNDEVSLEETSENDNGESAEETSSGEAAKILTELTEQREESSKTFELSDGTFMVAQYDEPVHYEDEDGKWQEIDYSLEAEGTGTDEEGYQTTVKSGKSERIKFSKKLKEGKTVSIKNTDYPLSWGIAEAAKATVEVSTAEGEEPKNWNDKFLLQDMNSQVLTYSDIFEGVDAEYLLQSGGIKENIILKEAGTIHTFEVVYDIGELTAEQKDEQTIHLKKGDEVIYQICAPYMMDAKGEVSDQLVLTMEQTKKKEIRMTIMADEEWLSETDRAYPVTIDPTILTKTTKSAIDSTFVTSGKPTANYSDKFELLVGRESSSYEYCRSLVKINLPTLNPGDMVVNASLNLIMYGADFYSSTTPDLQINAHQITGSWDYSTVTWNSKPSHDSTVLDYQYIGKNDITNEKYLKTFDITEAVKGWYEGTASNYGIMIKSCTESGSYADNAVKGYFWPERYNSENELYPFYQITYRNNKGLEDYWTYTTLSAGTAGTAYINDYTGNLVLIHEDISTTGNLMPVSIQHVYNGYQMNKKFANSFPSAGRGWKLSIQQTLLSSEKYGLTGDSLEMYPYAYEDGDGTVHYFYKKEEDGTTKYLDEDGLGLELTISGNVKTIKDKDDNVMTFGAKGNLTSIADAYNNKITLSYFTAEDGSTNVIRDVTDGAGHILYLEEHNTTTYNLKSINDTGDKIVSFSFATYNTTSGNKSVSKIHYADGTSSSYTYDSEGSLLTATSSDGSGLRFTYTSKAKGKRVSKVEEFGTDGTTGQTITFDRSKCNTTIVRTSGQDDIFNNSDDLITTYKFDNFGRTIATNSKTSGGIHYGGDMYAYTAGEVNSSGSNIGKLNRVSESAFSSKCVYNLLKNHSAESGSGWNNTYWLSSNSNYEVNYSDLDKLYGNRSFEIYGEQGSENGGGAFYQVFTTDELEPGKDYTFSGYIKTVNVTKANNVDAAYGGCLAVRFTSSSGSFTRLYSDYITDTSPTGYNDGWRRVKLSFTVPTDATEVRVYMVLRNSNGTAFFDGLQLETGTSANAYNLLSNSSFEKISSNKPSEWTLVNNNSNDGNSSTHYFSGTTALKFEGEASVNKYAYQNVAVSGTESDIYIASGWAWAEALPDAEDITRSFDIFARVYYSDNTSVLKSKKAEFNRDVNGWQRASMAFDLNDGDDTKKRTPTEIRVGVRYYKQENEAYFDSLQLVKDIANSYTYDKDGNLITAKENGSQSSALNYDDNSNLTSLTDAENNLYEYEYNTKHQVTEATAPLGQKISYTYKSKGPLSSTEVSSPGGDLKLKTEVLCNNSSGGINAQAYVTQEKDQNGYITRYNVDLVSGRTNSVTTPDGTVTSYSYNTDNDLLTSVSSGGKTVSYNYDSSQSKLLSIGHNGFNYNFTYDVFGNVLSTSVGSQALSTNTYAANNGKLTTITYGNEDTKSYTYTKAGNLSTIKENGTKTDSWTYNYSQQPMTYTDHETGQKHSYSYDITGRLLETTVSDTAVTDTAKDSRLFTALYGYDELNRLERERVYAGTRSPYAIYSYNENSQASKVDFSNGRSLSYTYDSLGRLTGKDYSTTTVLEYDYLYHTSKRAETEGTQYKTTQVKNELMGNMGYRYTYDEMGNITLIEEGTRKAGTVNTLENLSDKISYVYDDQSQLIRENNLYLDKTIVYTYDNGGNIVSRAEYDYTTDEDLSGKTVKSSINYTYDSTWKDLLKSYNGSNITYDEIGNPLNYLGKTMVWNGRTLENLTEDGTTISYDYNSDGLRTRKTVGNKTHEYYYSNGQLAYEKRSDGKEVFYTYDADGLLVLIQYVQNGSHVYYYPMLNSRGDVEALYTYQGELVARYYYDTWGNVIGIKDASGNDITATDHIANVNPIRYRGYYYDVETGFYYVSSRYYDPEVGRWINADGYITTGQGVLSYNMYAYCGNNPVNRIDSDGHAWKDVKNWFSKTWNKVKTWAKKTFGKEHTTSNTVSKKVIPEPSPIVVTTGTTTTTTTYKKNNSNPIVGYAGTNKDGRTITSTMGARISVDKVSIDVSIGFDDIGVTGSYIGDYSTESIGVRLNINEMKAGLEYSSTIQWDTDITNTTFTNVSISALGVAMAYALVNGYTPAVQR